MYNNYDPVERMISAVAYFWVLFFLPLLLIPRSEFGRFHADQGLLNLIVGVLLFLLMRLLPVVRWLFGLLMLAWPIWGILHAMRGEARPFPVIGQFRLLR